ncbi:efflux RND transporter periplasmic adaptor subunit [Pseudotabrizicola sediminis]|uniref:Efflux RND transporter periplasmic adaptor subunit n=1 Tax=Pseudotabrizicola sediminis TaxID=2486418 RepID=A0ABY2KQG1_9RHOB|nr:efflux RND transporter periplasmic adaptor subunit [Pseudotabrizicola sediminis]TGD45022.1 efflux RND transporter periplasmic adaptor subunit [Pseudotabrizicola sediminis]
MRILPPLTALAVAATLYVAVFERDRLMATTAAEPGPADADTSAPTPTDAAMSVVATVSAATMVQNAVVARGRTEAARQVEVRAETGGLVRSDPLRRGAFVTTGQTLCALDPGTRLQQAAEAEARVTEAQARLREAEVNAEAANRLNEGGFATETRRIGAEAALESARAGVQGAQSALDAIRIDISRLTVTAPFEGLLETDTAELGSLLQPGGACGTVIQLDPIKLVGFVPETEVDRISVGAIAGARLISGREVQGRVTFLSRVADPATRTFRVEVTVPNTDLSIRDGQTAEMLIAADGVMAHLLPASSLTLDNAGVLGVQLAVDDRASFAPVTVLRDTVDGMLVTGLPDQATVITVGQDYVTDGTAITVTLQQAAP